MINLFGHNGGQFGVAEAARRLSSLLEKKNTVKQVDVRDFNMFPLKFRELDNRHAEATLNVFAVNPDETALAYSIARSFNKTNVINIGFWAWELPDFPQVFSPSLRLLDEVWTVSSFVSESILRSNPGAPVSTVKLPVPGFSKDMLNQKFDTLVRDNLFSVLSVFDFNSDFERKNVLGNIAAYVQAFPKVGSQRLILKSINHSYHLRAFREMVAATKNRSDILIITESITKEELSALLYSANVFLSLHRSEGYGINLVDSMARGTVVIATGFSGNLDFQNQENSILVPFKLVPVSDYAGWRVKSFWAEPDISFAAEALRELRNNVELRARIANKAANDIEENFNLDLSVTWFEKSQFGKEY